MKRMFLALTLALTLGACAIPMPTPDQSTRANLAAARGDAPTNAQAEAAILEALKGVLKDPDSIKQFRMTGGPIPVEWARGLVNGGGFDSGWVFCFEYNAKNSYGGYVGVKSASLALVKSTYGDYASPTPTQPSFGLAGYPYSC